MKLKPRDSRNALSALRLSFALSLAILLPLLLYGSAPSWWSQRGVLVENASPDDYAPANQGQLKNIANAAVAEMDARLTGGAGDELHNLINSWSIPTAATNDFAPLNLGQLKNVAKMFYDRLIVLGIVDHYPWLASLDPPDDLAVVNIGQVKKLFSFQIPASNLLDDPLADRITAGEHSANLALESSVVWSWHSNAGTNPDFERNYPRRVVELSGIRSVSAGDHHLVALSIDGSVLTWGENNAGQLGDPTSLTRDAPVLLPNLTGIISIKAGGLHTLALKGDGTVVAWGDNYYGQLGSGGTDSSSVPAVVNGLTNVRRIAAGYQRSVAIKNDGTVWTWGYDYYNGHDVFNPFPSAVPSLANVIDVAAGYEHTVAVKADGTVWAWGSNYVNQIGNGNPWWKFQDVPVPVPNLSNIAKVAASYEHNLALAADGTVWAWGKNFSGQLGDGTTESRTNPVQVAELTQVIAVAAADSYSLAMRADGTVWAWGDGATGMLPGLDLHVPQQVGLGLLDGNHNGMDDRWELRYLGNLDQSGDADLDGDGISNRQEYLRGTDPADFYNGIAPLIEIVSGNNQIGDPGTFLNKPFRIRVRNAAGQPFANAPIRFSSTGWVATTLNGPQEGSLLTRTDVNGETFVYHVLSDYPGGSTRTVASAESATLSESVAFRGIIRFSLPPTPTPSPIPPDPNASPTPPPSPTATPIAPYRYAIIDLGKSTDLYPLRVNNKGWVLLSGFDASGEWGYYRWKGGTMERLTYSGPGVQGFNAVDMNDEGVVVGAFRRAVPWVNNAENYFGGGLTWAPDSSQAVDTPAPVAARSWYFNTTGTINWAGFTAITNNNEVYSQVLTSGGTDVFLNPFYIYNAFRGSVQLSFGQATKLEAWFPAFALTGASDRVSRANGNGHYIGRKFTFLGGVKWGNPPILEGTSSEMVDGQSVNFDPVDLNEEGIVVGWAWPDMVVYSSPTSQLIISSTRPLAINDHTRPGPSPQTPIPAPQILAWTAEGALVIWERQDDGKTWHPFGLEEMIPSMDNWQSLQPYDINDSGAIVGRGWYKDPSIPGIGEYHAFMLVPAELMVDGNRDGNMSFDDPAIHGADETSEEKPYRFWVNDDDDGAAGDPGEHVPPSTPDYADGMIRSIRDLEDFTRLHFNVVGFEAGLESGSIKAAFEWNQVSNNPRIKVYRAPAAGTDYLTSESKASATTLFPFRDTLGEVVPGIPLFMPQTFWASRSLISDIPKTLPTAWFLFEGSGEGKGQLVMSFWKDGRKIGNAAGVWLEVKDIKKMYQRANAAPDSILEPYAPNARSFDDESVSYSPDVTPRFEPPSDEEEQCLVFVHGWKASEDDATAAGQSMFKRLWWEGYRGRFATLRWPTKTAATSYNTSEWLAWKYGKSLADYVTKYIKQQLPSYRVSIAAHSMGNIVTGGALKRGMTLDRYMLMEAAVPAGCYEDSVNNYPRFLNAEATHQTPDTISQMGYRLFLGATRANIVKFVSFFNIDDFALATGVTRVIGLPFETNWEKNQVDYKPDNIGSGQYLYFAGGNPYYLTGPGGELRKINDVHESMAFVARPRSKAAGAEPHNATVFGSVFNLETACNFGADAEDHSGQFTRPIQQLRPFYQRMVSELKQ